MSGRTQTWQSDAPGGHSHWLPASGGSSGFLLVGVVLVSWDLTVQGVLRRLAAPRLSSVLLVPWWNLWVGHGVVVLPVEQPLAEEAQEWEVRVPPYLELAVWLPP